MTRHVERSVRRRAPVGFTLIEVLLAALLASVLLAGLWSLLTGYMRMFDSGQRQTDEAQLVRSIVQELTADLQAAAFARPAPRDHAQATASSSQSSNDTSVGGAGPAAPIATAPARQRTSGLLGTAHSVTIDVARPISLLQATAAPALEEADADLPVVPELCTVVYEVRANSATEGRDDAMSTSLVRRTADWPHAQSAVFLERSRQSSRLDDLADDLDASPSRGEVAVVPEIEDVILRYFDGAAWRDAWDSHVLGKLPIAVEATIVLRAAERRRKPVAVASETGDAADAREPRGATYRVVIALNGRPVMPSGPRRQANP